MVPEIDRPYRLVRIAEQKHLFAGYRRFADSSGIVISEGMVTFFELDPDAWKKKWETLVDKGYVVLEEAIAEGMVTEKHIEGAEGLRRVDIFLSRPLR